MKIRYLLFVLPVLCLGLFLGGCGGGGNNNQTAAISCPANYISNGATCVPITGATAGYSLNSSGQCITTATGQIAPSPTYCTSGIGGVGSCQGSCQAGYTYTQYGCLPQGSCAVCQATYNGTCINGVQTGATGIGGIGTGYPTGYPYGTGTGYPTGYPYGYPNGYTNGGAYSYGYGYGYPVYYYPTPMYYGGQFGIWGHISL
jgi:hypothetical protein